MELKVSTALSFKYNLLCPDRHMFTSSSRGSSLSLLRRQHMKKHWSYRRSPEAGSSTQLCHQPSHVVLGRSFISLDLSYVGSF